MPRGKEWRKIKGQFKTLLLVAVFILLAPVTARAASTMAVTTSDYSGTYNGSSHTFTIKVSGPSSYTIYYSTSKQLTSSNYTSGTTTKPSRTTSGTSTVYYYVKDRSGSYNDASGQAAINIKPKVTATAVEVTYDGSSHQPTVSATGSATLYYSTAKITYSNYSGKTSMPSRTGYGTTTVNYIAVPNSGASEDSVTTGSTTIKINKKNLTMTAKGYSGTYDGNAHGVTINVSDSIAYTIYYNTSEELTDDNYESIGDTDAPTRTNSGTTIVYYYIESNNANYVSTSGTLTIYIEKKNFNLNIKPYTGTYNGNSHTITMTVTGTSNYKIYYSTTNSLNENNYSSYGSTTKPKATNNGTTTVYYYVRSGSTNYNSMSGSTSIKINPATMVVDAEAYSGKYDKKEHSPKIKVEGPESGKYTVYYSTVTELNDDNYSGGQTTIPTRTNAGTTTVYYYVRENNDNYKAQSGSTTITIISPDETTSANRLAANLEGKKSSITVTTSDGKKRTYQCYNQSSYNGKYGGKRGCAITATAIVLSGLVSKNITPGTVHQGTSRYSEKYAISNISSYGRLDSISASKRKARLGNSTPTNVMLQKILNNAGLKTKYVSHVNANSVTEVTNHLAKGNPVIFTTRVSRSYKGVILANSWHTLVMVGLDKNGKVVVINPAGGTVNTSHVKRSTRYFHFTVSELLSKYQAKSHGASRLYSGNRYGYILISK